MIRKETVHIIWGTIQAGLVMLLLGACSTTKHLPEGEILYTGSKTIVENEPQAPLTEDALTELDAALDKAPSTKILGFVPIPFKMWAYNSLVRYKKGFGHWLFNRFAANPPVFISTVNPEIRAKVGTNLLHDYGYFNGTVRFQTVPDKKDSLKASIRYTVDMKDPYYIDTVYYTRFNPRTLRIMERGRRGSLLTPGEQFNVSDLDAERSRISTLLRNRGYFYFRPDYMKYQADTLLNPGHVSLRLIPVPGLPDAAQRPYYVGKTSVFLYGKGGEAPNSTLEYRGLDIHYYKKMQVRPNMLYRWLNYQAYVRNDSLRNSAHSRLYSQYRQTRIQERLSQLSIFRYLDLQYIPQDSTATCDTLNVRLQATFDKPYDAELEFNLTTKSNNQTGPGASFGLTRYNVFGGGETWNVKLKGSYEWQTGKRVSGNSSAINSWEFGISGTLTFPRVLFPSLIKHDTKYPSSTSFRIYADQLNRAKFFKMLAFGGSASYEFQPSATSHHSVTPFKLTYSLLQHTTHEFDSIVDVNKALGRSLENQFIPSMGYTYTYDDSPITTKKNHLWWQSSITQAGLILDGAYAIAGKSFNKRDKKLLGNRFAQFAKLTSEIRYNYYLGKKQHLVGRLMAGVAYSYGNSITTPYSEQFYIGGANSIRAFTIRSIGPGSYRPTDSKYGYLDQTGDIKFEANLEYRFPILGDLHGATFLDAGNVWLLRYDKSRPGGQLKWGRFLKDLALGTGIGLRYDLTFLVIRLDWGIGLHVPYDTGKKGYYNIPDFKDGMGVHLAIGYPF